MRHLCSGPCPAVAAAPCINVRGLPVVWLLKVYNALRRSIFLVDRDGGFLRVLIVIDVVKLVVLRVLHRYRRLLVSVIEAEGQVLDVVRNRIGVNVALEENHRRAGEFLCGFVSVAVNINVFPIGRLLEVNHVVRVA